MEEMNLIQQGYFQLKCGSFSSAKELFIKALSEKEDVGAHIGILLAENALTSEDRILDLPEPLSSYGSFRAALACADESYLTTLQNYEKAQEPILRDKQRKYEELLSDAAKENKSGEELKKLIGRAIELRGFKDSERVLLDLESEAEALEDRENAAKRKRRRILLPILIIAGVILTAVTIFFMLPKVEGVRYVLTLNGYKAISCDKETVNARVADSVYGVSVIGIDDKAFKDCDKLESVQIGRNVEVIGRSAFNNCRQLKNVTGAESVRTVETNAFKDCKKLREIRFSPGCQIDKEAFKECSVGLVVYVGDQVWKGNDEI